MMISPASFAVAYASDWSNRRPHVAAISSAMDGADGKGGPSRLGDEE